MRKKQNGRFTFILILFTVMVYKDTNLHLFISVCHNVFPKTKGKIL